MTKKAPQETRQKLIEAAIFILASDPTQFTLDHVAAEAKVSKGGLLHHFPTKEALLNGIIEFADQVWVDRFADELKQEPEGVAGRWCRAYIRASFDLNQEKKLLISALAKARNLYPDALSAFESKEWGTLSDDGLPPGRALVIQLTCDGLWFAEYLGTPYVSTTQLALVKEELERLTR